MEERITVRLNQVQAAHLAEMAERLQVSEAELMRVALMRFSVNDAAALAARLPSPTTGVRRLGRPWSRSVRHSGPMTR